MTTDPHTVEQPGKHRELINTIDAFYSNTFQGHTVEVK